MPSDLGVDELARVEDRPVDVRLGGEVHDRLAPGAGELDRRSVGDVAVVELVRDAREVGRVARVGEPVEHDHVVADRGAPLDEVRADEPRAARDQDPHRHSLVRDPREAGTEPVAPVREPGRLRVLAAQHRVRGPGCRARQLGRRDPPHAARQPGLGEDRLGEVGPGAVALGGDVVEPVREPDERARGGREVSDVASATRAGRRPPTTSSRSRPSASIVRTKFVPVAPKSHDERTTQPSRTSRSPASFVRP